MVKRLTQQQLHGYLNLLILAGNETTRNATTGGVLALLDHPGERERLESDPDRWIEPAVEEILRWTSPVIQFARTAVRDTEIRGVPIRAGDTVGIWYPSANRDPDAFDRPDRFDITREPELPPGLRPRPPLLPGRQPGPLGAAGPVPGVGPPGHAAPPGGGGPVESSPRTST